jgi:alcohol dehydrogenase class IV
VTVAFLQLPALHFGLGALARLPEELGALGVRNPLFVTDQGIVHCGGFDRVKAAMGDGVDACIHGDIPENPTYEGVDLAYAAYRRHSCDGVVAVGGGSVIDSAKIVAVLGGHGGLAADIVGFSERITPAVVPLVVIPTTAGTGSEVSPDAGVHPDAKSRSAGVTSRHVIPKVAICDPVMTVTLPSRLTASTGLDALSHCIEGYLAVPSSPPIDAMALDGISRVFRYLPAVMKRGDDLDARGHVMLAAFEGGAAIAKGLGPGHAIAISCGDQGLHHGVLSALGILASLPVMQAKVPEKVRALATAIETSESADVVGAVRGLMRRLGLPVSMREAGYRLNDMNELARACAASHFNFTSPYRPSEREFAEMLSSIH